MKSTLFNMVAVLFCITLVASAGVGGVYQITKEPIEQANAQAVTEALNQVLPAFDAKTEQELSIDEMPIVAYTATQGGEVVGYAVKTISKKGFGGPITLMVGFDAAGTVLNVNVLAQTETPGLGTKMADEGNPLIRSFQGKNPGEMTLAVTKDGGDVDALTAATISSRAYVDAMARAYNAYRQVALQEHDSDVISGATQPVKADETTEQTSEEAAREGGNNE